jgi:hypothetical protein
MDEGHDEEQGRSASDNESSVDKASPLTGAGETPASGESGSGNGLPIIESPQLGGGEAVEEPFGEGDRAAYVKSSAALPMLIHEPLSEESRAAPADPGVQSQSLRFALLAATIACAAGVGALAGSLTAFHVGQHRAAQAAIPRPEAAHDVVQALKAQRAEIAALKASLNSESHSANAQFGKISDRLNGLEHSQANAAAKFTHMAEAVDRLDSKTAAAPEITGSIAAKPSSSTAVTQANVAAPVLRDWIVQDVRNGRAMLENRYGGLFLVRTGSVLPGLGRIQEVRRRNGQWIVVTARGLITSQQ